MSDIAIKVYNLSKMYQIGEKQERYYTFRDMLTNIALAPFRRLRHMWRLSESTTKAMVNSIHLRQSNAFI
jgi:hypothetical protein